MQDGNLRESGSEFQRTLPEYTRLELKRSVGILNFPERRDWFREKITFREGGTFPYIMFVYQNSLVIMLSLSLRGRIDRKLQS